MGCDIHVALECRNSDGDWELNEHLTFVNEPDEHGYKQCHIDWDTSVSPFKYHSARKYDGRIEGRNYMLFGALTDGMVRYDMKHALPCSVLGLLSNYSEEVDEWIDTWDCDGHTHGSIQMDKYKETLSKMLLEGQQNSEAYGVLLDWFNAIVPYFGDFKERKPEDCRVIYFFDN